MSEPSPEQSFSIHLKSLTDFADEFTTQIQSLQAPMDHLATMSGTAPQYGAFHEAWTLGAGEQAAVEEMFSLLGQVKTAIAFAGNVTGTVADGYRNADEGVAWGMGGPPGAVYGGGGDGTAPGRTTASTGTRATPARTTRTRTGRAARTGPGEPERPGELPRSLGPEPEHERPLRLAGDGGDRGAARWRAAGRCAAGRRGQVQVRAVVGQRRQREQPGQRLGEHHLRRRLPEHVDRFERRAAAVDAAAGPGLRRDAVGSRAGVFPGQDAPWTAANPAGRFVTMTTSPTPEGVTDFAQYSLPQLTQMLYASDPATGTTTAQTWDATGKMLHEQASNLEGRLRSFDGEWQGTASDEYKRMVTDLIGGLRKVAETSLRMRDLTYDAVDSLVAARAAMPAAVDVPVVPPTTLALATTPLPIDATTSPAAIAQMQSDQAKAMSAVQAQQSAINAANSAHAQAVAVMSTLAGSYVVAQDRFPPTPGGATPTVNGTGPGNGLSPDGTPVVLDANGVPVLVQNTYPEPDPRRAGHTRPAGPSLLIPVRRHVHGRPGGGRSGRRREVRQRPTGLAGGNGSGLPIGGPTAPASRTPRSPGV